MSRSLLWALGVSFAGCTLGCDVTEVLGDWWAHEPRSDAPTVSTVNPPLMPVDLPTDRPLPKAGMVYIPPGALVVGTPPSSRPRRADREMPGEQVMLEEYFIDQFAFPNEEGAIPITNVSHEEAAALCAEKGKRLCTELEWERACKGPDNRMYEYGESYQPDLCRTGRKTALIPSGYNVACQSDFGVHDLHGGPFEWTASDYGRGQEEGRVALKGGNHQRGEVVGRCANTEAEHPTARSGTIGFRCCSGRQNEARVELEIRFPPGLIPRIQFEPQVEDSLIAALPIEARATLEGAGSIQRERVWLWRPIANEELHLMALCGRGRPPPRGPECGLLLSRMAPSRVQTLAWVSSGRWVANLHRPGPHELLFLIGGDRRGSFKRLIAYDSGDIAVGELSRGIPSSATSK